MAKKAAKEQQQKPAFSTIEDLLFELSKPPTNLKEDQAKDALKALGYKTFSPAKSQEMYDSVVAYMAQSAPTDEEKQNVITEDELPF